jgi:hypothetical protein
MGKVITETENKHKQEIAELKDTLNEIMPVLKRLLDWRIKHPTTLNGLKEIQFVFETIERLIPDSILSTEGKEKVRRAVEAEKVVLKLKIQQVEN